MNNLQSLSLNQSVKVRCGRYHRRCLANVSDRYKLLEKQMDLIILRSTFLSFSLSQTQLNYQQLLALARSLSDLRDSQDSDSLSNTIVSSLLHVRWINWSNACFETYAEVRQSTVVSDRSSWNNQVYVEGMQYRSAWPMSPQKKRSAWPISWQQLYQKAAAAIVSSKTTDRSTMPAAAAAGQPYIHLALSGCCRLIFLLLRPLLFAPNPIMDPLFTNN